MFCTFGLGGVAISSLKEDCNTDFRISKTLNRSVMKRFVLLMFLAAVFAAGACKKEKTSERFDLLTAHVWTSDSLLVNGEDASGPGEPLEIFKGDVQFNKDGTGTFGQFSGTWTLADNDQSLGIESSALPTPYLSTHIVELTQASLKVTFSYPSPPMDIRMTFKPG